MNLRTPQWLHKKNNRKTISHQSFKRTTEIFKTSLILHCHSSLSEPSLRDKSVHPSRKLVHLAVITWLNLQFQPAFTQKTLASSLPPSIHLNPRLFARFLSFRWKVNPLYSSEIKTGRCKPQINVIKCLCYHKPSHRSGWLVPSPSLLAHIH